MSAMRPMFLPPFFGGALHVLTARGRSWVMRPEQRTEKGQGHLPLLLCPPHSSSLIPSLHSYIPPKKKLPK